MTEVRRSLRWRAKRLLGLASARDLLTGALVAVQRSDSALRLNVRFHALVLDGVNRHQCDDPGAPLDLLPCGTSPQRRPAASSSGASTFRSGHLFRLRRP